MVEIIVIESKDLIIEIPTYTCPRPSTYFDKSKNSITKVCVWDLFIEIQNDRRTGRSYA